MSVANDNDSRMLSIPVIGEVDATGVISFYGRPTGVVELPREAIRLALVARALLRPGVGESGPCARF